MNKKYISSGFFLVLLIPGARLNAYADGQLDPTFGSPLGYVSTPVGSSRSVAIQTDEKIVAAGSDGGGNFQVARYKINGSLDITLFGAPNGYVSTPVGSARGVAIQTDGKIIAAGDDSGGNFQVVRYNTNGSLDTSFGTLGVVSTPSGAAFSVAIQADGKIVAVGTSGGNFRVARYNTDGSLDTATFGSGTGFVSTPGGIARSVSIQSDGKIVAAGNSGGNIRVARYNTDGSLDALFGTLGVVSTPAGTANGVAIQTDGKIVAAGTDGSNFLVVRYNTDGSLDTASFGVPNGYVSTPAGTANSVAIRPDGKIVVAGDSSGNFRVVRYNTDGSLDTTFGVSGVVSTPAGTANSVALQENAKIVAAGTDGEGNFRVARYLAQQVDPFIPRKLYCTSCGPIIFGSRGCYKSLVYQVGDDVIERLYFPTTAAYEITSIEPTLYDFETTVTVVCESC